MRRKLQMFASIVSCLAVALMIAGCDSGDEDTTTVNASVDITGTWRATYTDGNNTLTLAQSGNNVTGTYHDSDNKNGTITGTVAGSTFSFTVLEVPSDGGNTQGTANVAGDTMTGTFSSTYGDVNAPFTAKRQ